MNASRWLAILAFAACANAAAHDTEEPGEGRPHTHWWMGLGEGEVSYYGGVSLAHSAFSDWSFSDEANDGSYTSASSDDADVGVRIHAGLGFLRHFSLELGYGDHGEATFSGQSDGSGTFWSAGPIRESVAVKALDATLAGRWQLQGDVALTVRAGMLMWDVDAAFSGDVQSFGPVDIRESDDGRDLVLGASIDYDGLRPLRLSLGYTRAELGPQLQVNDDITIGATALTVSYLID